MTGGLLVSGQQREFDVQKHAKTHSPSYFPNEEG